MKLLVYIPARGGSKEIKMKNLCKIGNKCLIDFTLETIKKIKQPNYAFVSTDSRKIANYCNKKGIKIKYFRPKHLAGDQSNIIDGVFDAINWLKKEECYTPSDIMLLQPTSPFRESKKINKMLSFYRENNCDSIVSVTNMKDHPRKSLTLRKKGWSFIKKDKQNLTNRQQYENNYYTIDGCVYISKLKFLKKYHTFVKENKTQIYNLKQKINIDIDTQTDLDIARLIYKSNFLN